MNVQKSIKVAHTSSILISVILNGFLVAALLTFITFSEGADREVSTVMVIESVPQEDIEEIEEEVVPEEVMDPDEMDDLVDFTLDTQMDTDFEQDTEVVENVTETDVSALSELMTDVSSPVVMSGLLVGRTSKARQAALSKYGQGYGKFSEPAVLKALEWLRDNQSPDGSWQKEGLDGGNNNTGYTGLALLAFLAHGETPASAEFGPTVAKGIRFLVENQDSNGVFRPAGSHLVYGHAMATYAIAEAYTMTENILLREPLQRGVNVIQRGMMPNGGFDYNYAVEDRNDLSVGAWHVQALKAAYISKATGPDTGKYLQTAMDGMLEGSGMRDGGLFFAYSVNGDNRGGPETTICAAGTLALHLSGRGKTSEARDAVKYLSQFTDREHLPTWNTVSPGDIKRPIYYWYYAVQAFFQEDPEGSNFKRFMPAMVKAMVQNQADDGHWLCYTDRGEGMGKTVNTALGALGLMVYYRYLPTTQADNIQQVDSPSPTIDEEEGEIGFEI